MVGTNRSLNTVDLWIFIDEEINDSMMSELSNTKNNFQIPVKPNFRVKSESNIYGTCAGVHPKYGFVVFVTEDRGPNVEVYYLDGNGLNLLKPSVTEENLKDVYLTMKIQRLLFQRKM